MKRSTALIAMCCLLSIGASCRAESNGTYQFRTEIGRETADAFLRVVALEPNRVKWLIVDSIGGDVEPAIEMANVIHQHGISIYVDGLCASSCANYLFPAARSRVLGPGAIVAWHGSPASETIGGIENLSAEERVGFDALRRRLIRAERQLFSRIRVDRRLLCVGDRTIAKENALGWTMPVRSMSMFGLSSVISLGQGRPIATEVRGPKEPIVVIAPQLSCERSYKPLGPTPC